MFSFPQISRWLSFSADPLTVEDWLANREVFGPVEKPTSEDSELEMAFQTEQARKKTLEGSSKDWPIPIVLNATEAVGLVDVQDYLLIIPSGKAVLGKNVLELEISGGSEGMQKMTVVASDLVVISAKPEEELKIKVRTKEGMTINKKSEVNWMGLGKKKIIIDSRGRPLTLLDGERQRKFMSKVKELSQ